MARQSSEPEPAKADRRRRSVTPVPVEGGRGEHDVERPLRGEAGGERAESVDLSEAGGGAQVRVHDAGDLSGPLGDGERHDLVVVELVTVVRLDGPAPLVDPVLQTRRPG
jgi:hypothetical protein